MINSITSYSSQIQVSQTSQAYISNNGQSAGAIRFNTLSQQVEVYDGNTWYALTQSVNIGFNPASESAIMWAQRKMAEETELKALLDQHPGLKDLKEKFDLMLQLVKEHKE